MHTQYVYTVGNGQYADKYLGNAFYVGSGSRLETIELGEGITSIGGYLFTNATQDVYEHNEAVWHGFPRLTKVILPSTLTSMGPRPFNGSAITELVLGNGLAAATNAFSYMNSLKRVVVKGGSIGIYAFSNCTGLEEVILEEGVTSIGAKAFRNCIGLTSLTIPDSVMRINPGIIEGCVNIEYLQVGGGISSIGTDMTHGTVYSVSEGGFAGSELRNAFYVGAGSKLKTLVLNEGITTIGTYLFANSTGQYGGEGAGKYHGFTKLERVVLPSSLTTIGAYPFRNSRVEELELGNGGAATKLVFAWMTSLKKVTIKGGEIGQEAFAGCTGLEEVILEEGVTKIGEWAFNNCTGLKSLKIPNSVTDMRPGMLMGCVNLKYLQIGNGMKILYPDMSYTYCTINPGDGSQIHLTSAFYIGPGAQLETLVLSEGITEIGQAVFANKTHYNATGNDVRCYGFPNLKKVVLPSTLKKIATENLSKWGPIEVLELPSGLTSITDGVLSYKPQLYSDTYNQVIQNFATSKGLVYTYSDGSRPVYTLTCAAPAAGSPAGSEHGDEAGNVTVTRGVGGEEISLPDGFVILSTQEIGYMEPVETTEPAVTDGYAFYGWYTDPEFTEPWQLTNMPGANITLYARIQPLVTVKYAVNLPITGTTADESLADGFSLWAEYRVREYSARPIPEDPSLEGYALMGWYLDPNFRQAYVPGKVGRKDLTIYGNLQRAGAGAVYRERNGTNMLVSYRMTQGEDGHIHIPARVNGKPVTTIGPNVFSEECILEVFLPDTVTEIHPKAFTGTSINAVYISENNPNYSTENGILYSKDGSILIRRPAAKTGTSVAIRSGVTEIGQEAFAGNGGITSIAWNDELTVIGAGAFRDCTGLTTVTLPDIVTTMGAEAFAGCTGLTDFTAYGLTNIGADALPISTGLRGWGPIGDCVLRRQFTFETGEDENHNKQTVIWGYNLYTIEIYLDGVLTETLVNEAGNKLPRELKNVEFADGTQVLAWYKDSGFNTVWDLDSDTMPAENITLYGSKTAIFAYEAVTLTVDGTEISGIRLTQYNGKARDLVIPETYAGQPVIAVGSGFLSTYGGMMNSITIPECVKEIGAGALTNAAGTAFNGKVLCDAGSAADTWALENQISADVRQYKLTLRIDERHTISYDLGKGIQQLLTDPEKTGATFLGWYLDEEYENEAALVNGVFTMPGADTTLYAKWEVPEEILNLPFEWAEENGTITITGYTGTEPDVIIPARVAGLPVTTIGTSAFSGTGVRSIALGMVTTLREGAFSGCQELTAFSTDEENTALKGIDGVLFSNDETTLICYPRKKAGEVYTIPAGVATVGAEAFRDSLLAGVNVPSSVTVIEEKAFMGSRRLTEFTAENVTEIGDSAFFGCSSLTTVNAGNGLTTIGNFAFVGCTQLNSIMIPAGVNINPEEVTLFTWSDRLTILGETGSAVQQYAAVKRIAFSDPSVNAVTEITITGEKKILDVGEQMALAVTLTPENAASGTTYSWRSSDEQVAFVDDHDVLHVIGEGHATLTATAGNEIQGTYEIDALIPVKTLYWQDNNKLRPGGSFIPVLSILPNNATNQNIQWESSDESVAVFDPETGRIRALAEGKTVVTARAHNGKSASLTIMVFYPAETMTVVKNSDRMYTMTGYNTQRATVTILPENTTDQAVTWQSSNPAVAAVEQDGTITALGAGSATITVSGGKEYGENWSRSTTVTVTAVGNVLKMPVGLKTIEEEAFAGNSAIEGVILGNTVESIEANAFADMSSLKVVVIPGEHVTIHETAFTNSAPAIMATEESDGKTFAEENGLSWMPISTGD